MEWFWNKDKPKTGQQIQSMIDEAVKAYAVNNSSSENLRQIFSNALSGSYDGADTLHNIYLDYGYPDQVTFFNNWNMYRRFGVAKNVVELPVDTGWLSVPTIESDSKELLKDIEELVIKTDMWTRIKGLDTRQRVGRYAGMFMRVRDGKKPDEPIEGTLSGIASLMSMTPLYESQLKVLETDDDPMSDNFGDPVMYQFSGGAVGSRSTQTNSTFNIHPSRIVIAAEGADNGSIYGIPSLEAVYNSLMDLRKIIGAGGEGFYRNASQSVVFELVDGASAAKNVEALKKFNDNFDDFTRNRMRRGLWTPGLKPTVLQSILMDPKEFFIAAINDISSGSKIPATILVGQQTGRLASDEDSKQYLTTIQSRRLNFMTDMVVDIFDWLILFGILPAAEFEVIWDDLLASTDKEKLENSEKLSTINKNQFTSGGDVPFSAEEIRESAGYDPEELPEIEGEVDPDEDENSEDGQE